MIEPGHSMIRLNNLFKRLFGKSVDTRYLNYDIPDQPMKALDEYERKDDNIPESFKNVMEALQSKEVLHHVDHLFPYYDPKLKEMSVESLEKATTPKNDGKSAILVKYNRNEAINLSLYLTAMLYHLNTGLGCEDFVKKVKEFNGKTLD